MVWIQSSLCFLFFFLNDTATTEIYTLSLHDALPIFTSFGLSIPLALLRSKSARVAVASPLTDRKSTRLNSSHVRISYAVFCLDNMSDRIRKKLGLKAIPPFRHCLSLDASL